MRRLPVVVALLAIPAAAQQQLPGFERGLQADKLYQFNGFDNISVYGGNLSIRIPLGMTHNGDGGLSYQFSVNYNGKFFDYKTGPGFVHAYPMRSNAGMGWTFGFGRFIPKNDVTNSFDNTEVYESPDGTQNIFTDVDGTVSYAKEASLRLRRITTTVVEIDFPDGTVQRHAKVDGAWRLQEIRAPRGTDKMTIENLSTRPYQCPATVTTAWWRVSDGPSGNRREHYVCFHEYEIDDVATTTIERLVLHPTPAGSAVYKFQYEETDSLLAPGEYDDTGGSWRLSHAVPLLSSITLPDDSQYQFEHPNGDIAAVTLPTKARIEYTYGDLTPPNANRCFLEFRADLGLAGAVRGVVKRIVRTPATAGRPSEAYEWNYTRSWKALGTTAPNYDAFAQAYFTEPLCHDPITGEPSSYRLNMFDVMTVSVSEPAVIVDGVSTYSRIDSHYSVWPGNGLSPAGFSDAQYSYPHGPKDSAQNRYLSQEQYQCTNGTCTKVRTTYARHIDLGLVSKPVTRLESQRVVFNDDCPAGKCKWVTTDYEGRDGYDHFRTEITTHNFGSSEVSRKVTTDWNKVNGADRVIGKLERWFPNTYEKIEVTEGTQVRVEQACFDLGLGFLSAKRVLQGATAGRNDLIVTSALDSAGNLATERLFGGDGTPLPTESTPSPLCTAVQALATETPRYQVNHLWQNGVLASSQYAGTTHKLLDLTVDRTGLVTSSRDSAGVEIAFGYDASGRIKSIQPPAGTSATPGGAATSYDYTTANLASGSLVPATASQTTGTGTAAISVVWQFDSLGRVSREKRLLPGGGWSLRETLYDALGRKRSVSEPELLPAGASDLSFIPSAVTTFSYDTLGRTLTTTSPDASRTRLSYVGSRETSRFSRGSGETEEARGKETYDGFGRLVKVTEHPDAVGDVVTNYTYDAGGNLAEVQMRSPGGIVQRRTFDYDGRGFLRWEQQPESGMASYTYDAAGHVLTKNQSVAASQFDLKYTYDAAARLRKIEGRNPRFGAPGEPQFRVIKELEYATANSSYTGTDQLTRTNWVRGKLELATRYNYPPSGDETVYTIADRFIYADALGRQTVRETTIDTVPGHFAPKKVTTAVKYNDMGLPASFAYPMCVDCGAPATPDRSSMTYTYAAGRLTSIAGFLKSMTYWPNGMHNVLVHENDVADTQTVANMPRPYQIAFGPYSRCIRPLITAQPESSAVAAGGSATLSVTAAGTGPFNYKWFNRNTGAIVGYTQSITIAVSSTTEFNVEVSSTCGSVFSEFARVAVNACPTPETGAIQPIRQPDGSWLLTPSPIARPGAQFFWRKLPDNVTVGTGKTLSVANLDRTTTYSLTISDTCGTSSTTEVTIRIPLSITRTGLQATLTGAPNQVKVEWPAVTGATAYVLERRSGPNWSFVGTIPAGNTMIWTGAQPANTTYAYRVYAVAENSESEYSNADVVTTRSFTPAVAGAVISSAPCDAMLAAVNSVRAAAGWAPVQWQTILSPSDPLPVPGEKVLARHVLACRARMHEALSALGVPVAQFAVQELQRTTITAEAINEVQRRAQ